MIMATWIRYLITCVLAYCIGSISTGILVSRAMHGPDLRTVGSKNTGATNVQRTMGWKPGLITFFGDSLKAVLACWLGQLITGSHLGALAAGLFVVLGHNWPVFFRFKGGKGVAASAGMVTAFEPVIFLIALASFLAIAIITKYVSAGSLTCYAVFFLLVLVYGMIGRFHMTSGHLIELYLIAFFLTALCWWQHRENIRRLAAGTERKTHLFHRESDKE